MDWKKIKADYIAGGVSYRKLAEKYGVSQSTLRKVAAKEQWTELRNKTRTKMDEKISNSVSEKEADKAINIIDVADKLLEKISEYVEGMPFDMLGTSQTVKHLTSALKDLKEIKGYKSDADMREQEARIRNLERQAKEEDQGDKHVIITLDGDLSKYSK